MERPGPSGAFPFRATSADGPGRPRAPEGDGLVLENETAEALEESYRMSRDWNPDLAHWAMYTPWPFSDLFSGLGDKVEIFGFERYDFVTPIIKLQAIHRSELLDRVMHNYRRFYFQKALFSHPWAGSGARSSRAGCEARSAPGVLACGGGDEQISNEEIEALVVNRAQPREPAAPVE